MARPTFSKKARAALSEQRLRFVEEFVFDLDERAAGIRAGLPALDGPKLLESKMVQAAIQVAKLRRSTQTEVYANDVLRRWVLLATADARELVQVRMVACRYCWGLEHRFQFRDNELLEALADHKRTQLAMWPNDPEKRAIFDDRGGGGYDGGREPCRGPVWVERQREMGVPRVPGATADHNCPACDGDGERTVWVNDSRFYSAAGALLYNGVKVNQKTGSIELNLRDRSQAEKMIGEHLGMFVRRSLD